MRRALGLRPFSQEPWGHWKWFSLLHVLSGRDEPHKYCSHAPVFSSHKKQAVSALHPSLPWLEDSVIQLIRE